MSIPSANNRSNAKKMRLSVLPSEIAACSVEIGRAVVVEGDDFAVDQYIRKSASFSCDRQKFFGPIQTLAGLERGLAIRDAQLHPVAVEFDLVTPAFRIGRPVDRDTELRRDEIGYRRNPFSYGLFGGCAARCSFLV